MSLNSFRHGLGRTTSGPVGKWTVFIIGALLVASLVFSGLGGNLGPGRAGPTVQSGSDVVAVVNGDDVTREEYNQSLTKMRQQMEMSGQPSSVAGSAMLHNAALDQLITAKLALQQAKKLGLTASDDEITKKRQQIVTQSGLAQRLSLKPNASLSDINAALSGQGMKPVEQLFPDDSLRQAIVLDKFLTYLSNQVNVTEQDVRDSYKQYHTRHILIDNKKRSDVQAQSQAQQILAKAKAPGADFAALAKQYSEDPGTKDKGGDDGWIDQNTNYVPEFTKAAFSLKPGEITPEPVKAPQVGYFIIKLDAMRDNLPKDFEKNKAQLISDYKARRQQTKQQEFITMLKNAPGNQVGVKDPELKADRELIAANQASDPALRANQYKAALADYHAAAKIGNYPSGEISVGLAQAERGLGQTQAAITDYEAAAQATEDPDLHMILGNMYQESKQSDKALNHFQQASKDAGDNQNLHMELFETYTQMKRKDLATQEAAWMKDYQKRQQALSPAMGGMGGGIPFPTRGGGGGVVIGPNGGTAPSGAVTVSPASGSPAPPTPKPGQ